MLRILSSKIFREDLDDYALPMIAFEKFDDVENKMDFDNGTYKFCLPVSVGEFPETHVPACFSNNVDELRNFVNGQVETYHRKAFIISDFQVTNLDNVRYSGVINTSSMKGYGDFLDKSTSISITLKNPILTYGQEGISPRDLSADVELTYDHISNPLWGFPRVSVKNSCFDLELYKGVIYQAYMASSKIHKVAQFYDGQEYNEYALFFIDDKYKIWLYEIIGEESFLGRAKCNKDMIREELNLVTFCENAEVVSGVKTRKRMINY